MKITSSLTPVFPAPLKIPASLIPGGVHATIVVRVLNRLFAKPIAEGELDFLEGHSVRVEATDAGVAFAFGMDNRKLVTRQTGCSYNLTLRGQVYDFLLLASRREDADTLFFQRRLKMEGETDLGLEIKNFLDGMDPDDMPLQRPITSGLRRVSLIYERLF